MSLSKKNNTGSCLGKVVSINLSHARGFKKETINEALLVPEYGLWGDIHAGEDLEKQISLLPFERIQNHKVCPKIQNGNGGYHSGDFGENITLKGVDFLSLKLKSKITVADDIILEVSKIGRHCKWKCKFNHKQNGGCFIRCEGIFGRIVKGGVIKKGDPIKVLQD